jgi:CBS domain containing-hemolysin-like protein
MTVFVLAGIGLALLLYLSSAFSGSETAFFSLSRLELEELDPKGRVRRLMAQPERLLIAILLGNTLVNVAAGSLGALMALEFGRARGYPEAATIALEVGVVTLVILVLGEVAPKMHAMQRNIPVARRTAPIVLAVLRAFHPIVSGLDSMVSRLQGRLADDERPFVTAEELRTIVAISEQRGTLEEDERDMIDSVMEFGETVVREVMVPRVDMECFEDSTLVGDAVARIRELGLSRFPVYHGDIDHVDGVLYAKDLLKLDAEADSGRHVGELARPAHFTPETKKAGELLRELQRRRIHIAIVVDEYGGTAGLVTLEDVIEEIVGEIRDEYDEEEELVRVIDRSTVIADGMVRLEDLEEEMGVDLEIDGVETLGGLLMNAFGRIPSEGEKLERGGLAFTAESVEEQRIVSVRIERLDIGPKEDGTPEEKQ